MPLPQERDTLPLVAVGDGHGATLLSYYDTVQLILHHGIGSSFGESVVETKPVIEEDIVAEFIGLSRYLRSIASFLSSEFVRGILCFLIRKLTSYILLSSKRRRKEMEREGKKECSLCLGDMSAFG